MGNASPHPQPPLPSKTGEGAFTTVAGSSPFSPLRGEKGRGCGVGPITHHPLPTTLVAGDVHVATLEWQDLAFFGDEAVPPDAAVVDPEQVE
jgi:hypothetical protein